MNLLPNLDYESIIKKFSVKTNDHMHMIYVSSLLRAIIGLHNLINNKIYNKETEEEYLRKEEENKVKKAEKRAEKKAEENKPDVEMKDN